MIISGFRSVGETPGITYLRTFLLNAIAFMIYRFLKKYFTTAPIIFPLIGLFHILLTIIEAVTFFPDPDQYYLVYSLRPVVLAAYTTFWLACCFLRVWGALGYLFLTMANLSLYFFFSSGIVRDALGDLLFLPVPLNLLFCFLILFYYRRMQGPSGKDSPSNPPVNPDKER